MLRYEFKKIVLSRNLDKVRSYLIDILMEHRSLEEFYDSFNYAERFLKVMEKHDGYGFSEDESKWDLNYLNNQRDELMRNFSKERLEHFKNVIDVVLPKYEENFQNESNREVSRLDGRNRLSNNYEGSLRNKKESESKKEFEKRLKYSNARRKILQEEKERKVKEDTLRENNRVESRRKYGDRRKNRMQQVLMNEKQMFIDNENEENRSREGYSKIRQKNKEDES